MAFAYYLLKVIACSGVLFLYYMTFLKNRQLHKWNRFYLIALFLISAVIPIIQITITHHNTDSFAVKNIPLLKVVNTANHFFEDEQLKSHTSVSTGFIFLGGYVFVSVIMALSFLFSMLKVVKLIRNQDVQVIGHAKIIFSNDSRAPFSFLKYIIWNEQIDIESATGKQVFLHEQTHVRQKHSLDKIAAQIMIIIFWINPFFWLARKELTMIHDFIADKKAAGQDEASLAAMILQAAYPQQFSALVNPFFQSPVKRRIMMLSKNQKVNLPFLRKLLALPVLLVTTFAFTVRTKYTSVPLSKDITVVIDAGHGYKPDGKPDGAAGNNQHEADIVLSIANIVNQINSNPQIRIILSRTNKDIIDLKSRVAIAQNAHADLFISIHTNASASTSNIRKNNGFEIYVPSKNPPYQKESEIFASILQRGLTAIYPTSPVLLKSKTGIWVVDHNVCPSVLIECGDITNEKDTKFITEESNRKVIAETILNAIALYAKNKESVQQ